VSTPSARDTPKNEPTQLGSPRALRRDPVSLSRYNVPELCRRTSSLTWIARCGRSVQQVLPVILLWFFDQDRA
jgi:hypothetical protein